MLKFPTIMDYDYDEFHQFHLSLNRAYPFLQASSFAEIGLSEPGAMRLGNLGPLMPFAHLCSHFEMLISSAQ